ncbi:NUDIX hydrolase [Populibacterium corticicola]|uniref:NUDIX hydrolase n=1 Tax=Populibacterium corticicola TaxID=1812826 RepID=A0ABW5XEF0_9MICO
MEAKQDLERVLKAGLNLNLDDPTREARTTGQRKSAVMILFNGIEGHESNRGQGLEVLLTKRSDTLRHHPGQIAFPGGGIDPTDRGPEAAALRETAEETGIDIGGVEVLGSLQQLALPVSNNLVTPVLGWWHTPQDPVADLQETTEVYRVPVAQLLDPLARGVTVMHRAGITFKGPAFRFNTFGRERIVWGFTGLLLNSVFDQAGWTQPWDTEREIEIAA